MDQKKTPPPGRRELDLGFPPVDDATWRRRVEEELAGAGFESLVARVDGLEIEPLYAGRPADAAPRATRPADGGWQIACAIAEPSAAAAGERVAAERALGVELFWIRLDRAFRAGGGPEEAADLIGRDGVAVARSAELDRLLADAGLPAAAVVLDAGANALPAAAVLAAWAERNGVPFGELRGAVACDPLGALAADGALPDSLAGIFRQMADLAAWTSARAPGLRSVLVSTTPYHDAGATAVDELAFAAATGISYLRRLTAAGLGIDAAASRMLFAWSVGSDLFLEIAKLRAARLLWAKVVAACGGGEEARRMRLHARTSAAAATARAPRLNLLRGAVQGFAAAAGGADSIQVAPWDEPLGPSSAAGRRQAVCAQHLLAAEAHLARVADPGGGSWYVESLTEKLARAAWEELRDLERRGGMERAILDGRVAERVAAAAEDRRRAVAEGRRTIVGVTRFADPAADCEAPPATDLEGVRCGLTRALVGRTPPARELAALASAAASGGASGSRTAAAVSAAAAGATAWELAAALRSRGEPAAASALADRRLAAPFEDLAAARGEPA